MESREVRDLERRAVAAVRLKPGAVRLMNVRNRDTAKVPAGYDATLRITG